MSYILDALKKAERERGLSRVPTLETVHAASPHRRGGLWIAALVVLLAIAAAWVVYTKSDWEAPEAKDLPAAAPESRASAPMAVISTAPVIRPSLPDAALRQAPSAGPAGDTAPSAASSLTRSAASSLTRSAASSLTPSAASPLTRSAASSLTPSAASPLTPSAASPLTPSAASAKPLKEAAAAMIISIHLFSERPAERLVFINGRRYAEGDLVDGAYRIEAITPKGVTLYFEGDRETLVAGDKDNLL